MNSISFGANRFCGPSVISAITGVNTDVAASILSSITGVKKIKGVYLRDLKSAFNLLGYDSIDVPNLSSRSLFSSLFDLSNAGTYVFMITGHYICIEVTAENKKLICDNHTKQPINVGASARLNMKVIAVIRVVKK